MGNDLSNRCFPTKAIATWLQADDISRVTIVACYFHYSTAWTSIEAFDTKEKQAITEQSFVKDDMANPSLGLVYINSASAVAKMNQGDPMSVVVGIK
jgi:hypothetical protein